MGVKRSGSWQPLVEVVDGRRLVLAGLFIALGGSAAVGPTPSWSDLSTGQWDCSADFLPLVTANKSGGVYVVKELADAKGGSYVDLFELDYSTDDVWTNAGDVYTDGTDAWLLTALGGQLCRFDGTLAACFTNGNLSVPDPDGGVIVGSTYYYSRGLNDTIYAVTDLDQNEPTFVADGTLFFNKDLFAGSEPPRDWAAVLADEFTSSPSLISDGDVDGDYLIGLGGKFEVIVVRLAAASGMPDRYAVMGADPHLDDDDDATAALLADSLQRFDAAFSFAGGSQPRILFESTRGIRGLWEVELPFTVPTACWNTFTDPVVAHVNCTANVDAVVTARSTDRDSGDNAPVGRAVDGLSCRAADMDSIISTVEATCFAHTQAETVYCDRSAYLRGGAVCTHCPSGSYCDGDRRWACPEGCFSFGGSERCEKCRSGWLCSAGGIGVPCGAVDDFSNYYAAADGACATCPVGHRCSNGAATPCANGTYAPAFRLADHIHSCIPCAPGRTSGLAASMCVDCAAGRTSNLGAPCVECAAGEYAFEGAHPCTSCPAGFFSKQGAADCLPCPTGFYSTEVATTNCTACPEGTTSSRLNSTTCETDLV